MARNFPNFLDAFYAFTKDDFAPPEFYMWSGISLIAAALERRVWIVGSKNWIIYPNLYVMLVAKAGLGKSTAIRPAERFLHSMNADGQHFNILPAQFTDAALFRMMNNKQSFEHNNKFYAQEAAYWPATEGSSSLQDLHGNLMALLTQMYDCEAAVTRTTAGGGENKVSNPCLNIIAGCTFEHLGKVLHREGLHGGFASRFIYVVHDGDFKKKSSLGYISEEDKQARELILQDLKDICSLTGPMFLTPEFAEAYEKWFDADQEEKSKIDDEDMLALRIRKSTNLLKLCIICSVAEASDRKIHSRHLEQALSLLNAIEPKLEMMVVRSKATKTDTHQGLNAAINTILANGRIISKHELTSLLCYTYNYRVPDVNSTLSEYLAIGVLEMLDGTKLRLRRKD